MKHFLTKDDFESLREDIRSKEHKLKELSKQLGEAAKKSSSFVSNNPEYVAILDQVDALQKNIDSQKEFLGKTQIVEFEDIGEDKVDVYSLVKTENTETGDVFEYYIHYPNVLSEEKSNILSVASPLSPIGKALIGRKIGDIVKVELPNRKLQLEVIGIKKINL
jgi:transcription elongation factor GreA